LSIKDVPTDGPSTQEIERILSDLQVVVK